MPTITPSDMVAAANEPCKHDLLRPPILLTPLQVSNMRYILINSDYTPEVRERVLDCLLDNARIDSLQTALQHLITDEPTN